VCTVRPQKTPSREQSKASLTGPSVRLGSLGALSLDVASLLAAVASLATLLLGAVTAEVANATAVIALGP